MPIQGRRESSLRTIFPIKTRRAMWITPTQFIAATLSALILSSSAANNNDFRLCVGPGDPDPNCKTGPSAAINYGTNSDAPFNVDIAGTLRPQPQGLRLTPEPMSL